MPDMGTLGVRVFTSRAQLPVEGATVIVTRRRESGRLEVLSLQETDRSGSVERVTLPAPDPQESTRPFGTMPPFARCDVWVEHPDYEFTRIEDVQVFPEVESVQPVDLTPLVAGESWAERSSVSVIPRQDL